MINFPHPKKSLSGVGKIYLGTLDLVYALIIMHGCMPIVLCIVSNVE